MKHWCACDRRWGTREGIVKSRQKKATKAKTEEFRANVEDEGEKRNTCS